MDKRPNKLMEVVKIKYVRSLETKVSESVLFRREKKKIMGYFNNTGSKPTRGNEMQCSFDSILSLLPILNLIASGSVTVAHAFFFNL